MDALGFTQHRLLSAGMMSYKVILAKAADRQQLSSAASNSRDAVTQEAQATAASSSKSQEELQQLQTSLAAAENEQRALKESNTANLQDLQDAQAEISRLGNELQQRQEASHAELQKTSARAAAAVETVEVAVASMQVIYWNPSCEPM